MKTWIYFIPFLVVFLAALVASSGTTLKEGFKWPDNPSSVNAPQADARLSQSAQDEVMANAKQNCIDLGRRVGEVLNVSNKLIDIKSQINKGAISLEEARRKLEKMVQTREFNCNGQFVDSNGVRPPTNTAYCNSVSEARTYLSAQLQPADTSAINYTTIRGINNAINQEFENIKELFRTIQTLSISLRCDKLL